MILGLHKKGCDPFWAACVHGSSPEPSPARDHRGSGGLGQGLTLWAEHVKVPRTIGWSVALVKPFLLADWPCIV